MPYYTYRLQVKGSFSQKGFGFSCMRLAYENRISGSLFYESSNSAIVEITGYEEDVLNLIDKCKQANYINAIHTLSKNKTTNKPSDFIMLNQID